MSTIAPPPQDTFQSATPEVAGALDDFSKRISELEASREYQALTIEAQYKELLKNEIQQRMEIRWQVIVIAIVVLVFMGFILAHGAHTFAQKDISGMPASLLIAMFVAPIVSISTISVMLLFGAFRQFKDEDIKTSTYHHWLVKHSNQELEIKSLYYSATHSGAFLLRKLQERYLARD